MTAAGVNLENARVLVIGLARSGLAALGLLAPSGAVITAADSRPIEELPEADAAVRETGARFIPQEAVEPAEFALIVVSPGVPADLPVLEEARRGGIPVIGEMELASYFLRGPISAVTASNGKTTTTSLHAHILAHAGVACQAGGNLGVPPAAMVAASRDGQWNVLEVSSFQLETISHFRARIGVCLNVTEDHLDRHKTMQIYEAAKGRLFETQDSSCHAVLNADDAACVRFAGLGAARKVWFSLERPVSPGVWLDEGVIRLDGRRLMPAAEIPLRGRHNIQNVLAAAAASHIAGVPIDAIPDAIRSFRGVPHRLEFVARIGGVDYYNDSKATNVDAALKAIDAFPSGIWIILGGKDKGSDYRPLRGPLAARARAALLIGQAAEKIASQIEGSVPLADCGDLAAAVAYAATRAAGGDTILLAPACASFDQFQNFEHRGEVFKRLVQDREKNA
jgi:UDP-N-acetylmuramoylalanine--D-glutamate ligase